MGLKDESYKRYTDSKGHASDSERLKFQSHQATFKLPGEYKNEIRRNLVKQSESTRINITDAQK